MAKRRKPKDWERSGPSGFVIVDKPRGLTSHDVVDVARRWFGTRQVGHLGTLDPLATGVLPLAIRSATKLVPFLADGDKRYEGTVRLGEETDTLDAEGEVVRRYEGAMPDVEAIRTALSRFSGEIEQLPPMYSAVKQGGVPLHRLARQGREVERTPKKIRIDRVELTAYEPPECRIDVACSVGTYVRVLAADLGTALGCGAHLRDLCRTRSGPFELRDAANSQVLTEAAARGDVDQFVIAAEDVLGIPVLELDDNDVHRIEHGGDITSEGPPRPPGSKVAALRPGGGLLAVLEVRPGRRLHPLRVLPALAPQG
jgi:tRNA pseudouridine55 synthase